MVGHGYKDSKHVNILKIFFIFLNKTYYFMK